jgi:hypothetical protein
MFVHTPNVLWYAVLSYHFLVTTRHHRLFECLLTFLYYYVFSFSPCM